MSVCSIYNRDPDRRKTWFVKGAPEIILKSCFALQTQDGRQSMTEKIRRNFMGKDKILDPSNFLGSSYFSCGSYVFKMMPVI